MPALRLRPFRRDGAFGERGCSGGPNLHRILPCGRSSPIRGCFAMLDAELEALSLYELISEGQQPYCNKNCIVV
jgi:hypothetical protein